MVAFGVTKLFKNIRHELGKQATLFSLEKYPETSPWRLSKKSVTDGLELFLNNNPF